MAGGEDSKDLEQEFSRRHDTLRMFYDAESVELSEEEKDSLTPILNSLQSEDVRYRKIEEIAEGGEKRISLVHDSRLDRNIAMAHAVRGKTSHDQEEFLREARLTAKLAHPNIMPIFNMGLDDAGAPFFSMELVPGESLKKIVRKLEEGTPAYQESFSRNTLLHIFLKVCDAIAYSHSRDVLHLDIKPDNIQVGEFGEVLVCDWGLARVISTADTTTVRNSEEFMDGDVLNDLTLSGTMKGTPGFMAPEQTVKLGEKTRKTDIYSLGALLYMLLTYKLPVNGKSASEVIKNTKEGNVVPIQRRRTVQRIPKSLAAVTMKALSLKPEDRYESVLDLRRDVELFLSGHATAAERAGVITKTSLLLHRHHRSAFILIALLIGFAGVMLGNSVVISRGKNSAIAARERSEENLRLYKEQQQLNIKMSEGLDEAVFFTARSRDFMNAESMINVLESGLLKNLTEEQRINLYEQKGILHFVLSQFSLANQCFEVAGEGRGPEEMRRLSARFAKIKPDDSQPLNDAQLADLLYSAKSTKQMTLYYMYYHHMQNRPDSATPEDYLPLAMAMLDKLNYTLYAQEHPFVLEEGEWGRHLNLSRAPFYVYHLDILGVYRQQILEPLKLDSLDVSYTTHDYLFSFLDQELDEINISGMKMLNMGRYFFVDHVSSLKLKRIILNEADFPADTITALREQMEVVDAQTVATPITPAPPANAESPESTAP